MKFMRMMRYLSLTWMLGLINLSTSYASYPIWTFTPNSHYPPQISLNSSQTGFIVYTIQNQSNKSKSLMIETTPGLEQILPCNLNPIGKPGSTCDLVLSVTGNLLPKDGIHSGPILC